MNLICLFEKLSISDNKKAYILSSFKLYFKFLTFGEGGIEKWGSSYPQEIPQLNKPL